MSRPHTHHDVHLRHTTGGPYRRRSDHNEEASVQPIEPQLLQEKLLMAATTSIPTVIVAPVIAIVVAATIVIVVVTIIAPLS